MNTTSGETISLHFHNNLMESLNNDVILLNQYYTFFFLGVKERKTNKHKRGSKFVLETNTTTSRCTTTNRG